MAITANHTKASDGLYRKSAAAHAARKPQSRPRHYVETRAAIEADPLTVAGRLATSGIEPSYVVMEQFGTWRYAAGIRAEITLDRGGAVLRQEHEPDISLPWDREPLKLVSELLDRIEVPAWRAYGWAAFELSYAKYSNLEHVGDDRLLHLIVPRAEAVVAEGHADLRAADELTLMQMLDVVDRDEPSSVPVPRPLDVRAARDHAYCESVRAAVEEINAGGLQKVILSRVVEAGDDIDLVATYLAGRRANRPARSFLLRLGDLEATGFSPEIVVSVGPEGRVTSQPLAGTRALVADPHENEILREDLLSSPKEIYEHAISVKVGTDELTDICVPGNGRGSRVHGRPRARHRPASRLAGHRAVAPRSRCLGRVHRGLPRRHGLRRAEGRGLRRDPQARARSARALQRRGADDRRQRRDGCRPRAAQRVSQGRPDLAARRRRDRRPVRARA